MGQGNEPSMEEILSSIKRIIAEDNDVPAPPRRPAPPRVDEPDVLELTQAIEPGPDPIDHAGFDHIETMSMAEPAEEPVTTEPEPFVAAAALAAAPVSAAPLVPEPLLSAATTEASRAALAALSRMVVKPEDPAADNTLEGLVRELLRPMLKEWLDMNLPGIVQATVDREVARIAGRTL